MQQHRLLLSLVLLLAPAFAMAQDKHVNSTPLPKWGQLSSAQRDDLIAPLRDRWNSNPSERTRMYERARRWKAMPADARQRAHHGMQRWEKMSPEQRQHAQALFHAMRRMDEGERKDFLAKWHAMSPQQRSEWVDAHPAPEHHHGPDRD
jgi:hypothetical protein